MFIVVCYTIKFCMKINKLSQRHSLRQPKLMEKTLYWDLWFLSGTKFLKRTKKMWKTILILEDQYSSTNDTNVEMVWAVIAKDHWLSIRTIAEKMDLNKYWTNGYGNFELKLLCTNSYCVFNLWNSEEEKHSFTSCTSFLQPRFCEFLPIP